MAAISPSLEGKSVLIVAVDFGTTYSGVCFAYLDKVITSNFFSTETDGNNRNSNKIS